MIKWLRDLIKPECPHCAGESGSTDYWGEFYECPCCWPVQREESDGRVWRWRLWQFNYRNWKMDRWIDRQMKREAQ